MTATPAKVCISCGQDCAGRPRVRDGQGRYMCRPCADAGAPRGTPARQDVPTDPADVDIGYALAEEQAAAAPVARDTATCMGCGVLMAPGAVLCTRCGYDTRAGAQVKTSKGKGGPKRCEKCGYDLTGLKKPKCPECGTVFTLGRDYNKEREEFSKDTARWAYLKPLIMFGIGAGIMLMVGGASQGGWGAALYLIKYAVEVPVGVLVFWLCCLVYLGFDAPMHLTALRLAGIYAVTDVVGLVAGFVPFPILPMVITLTVYIGLLMDLLDLDIQDAVILGFITGAAKMYAGGAIVYLLLTR
jgi:hypothetical protein